MKKSIDSITCIAIFTALIIIDVNNSTFLPVLKDLLAVLCSALTIYSFLFKPSSKVKQKRPKKHSKN